jgi:ABC-2 type transport system permease protein
MTIQKILGTNYKWLYLLQYNIKIASATIGIYFINVLASIIQTLSIVWVWKIANVEAGIFTYLIVGRMFRALIDCYPHHSIGYEVLKGGITTHLLKPTDFFGTTVFNNLGRRIPGNIIQFFGSSLVLIICSLTIAPIQINLDKILILMTFLPFAYLINYILGYTIGLLAFFVRDEGSFDGIKRVYETLNLVVIGTLIPLDKLPFNEFFELLPSAWILHQPMQIYLGKYNLNQILLAFAGAIIWSLILFIVARIIFQRGLKKNEAVGL